MKRMNRFIQYLKILLIPFLTISCTSKLIIQSDPPQSQVSIAIEGQDSLKIGITPLEISDRELAEKLRTPIKSNSFVSFIFEKENFLTKTVYVPIGRWNQTQQSINIILQPKSDEGRVAVQILQHLFNAKKFIETRQTEQAHTEVDKALTLEPKLTYAMLLKGSIYYIAGQWDEAEVWYKKAIDIEPKQTEAIKMLEKLKSKRSVENR